MQEIIQILIGLAVLALGIPIGNLLAKITEDELKQGRKWFKLIILLSLLAGLFGLVIENDVVMFTFFFIAIVTSRCVVKKK